MIHGNHKQLHGNLIWESYLGMVSDGLGILNDDYLGILNNYLGILNNYFGMINYIWNSIYLGNHK